MLTPESRFAPNASEVAAQVIGGEAILINLSSGIYYSIESAGGAAWSLLAEHYSLREIAEVISQRYAVDLPTAETDLTAMAEQLVGEDILRQDDAGSPKETVESLLDGAGSGQPLTYQKMHLNIYRDMNDLLALDPPMPGIDDIPWKPAGS